MELTINRLMIEINLAGRRESAGKFAESIKAVIPDTRVLPGDPDMLTLVTFHFVGDSNRYIDSAILNLIRVGFDATITEVPSAWDTEVPLRATWEDAHLLTLGGTLPSGKRWSALRCKDPNYGLVALGR